MKVRFTSAADRQLATILSELDEVSPQGARNVARRVDETVRLIADQPRASRRTGRQLYRRPVVPFPYVVFYRITDEAVVIVGILHGARGPKDMPDA